MLRTEAWFNLWVSFTFLTTAGSETLWISVIGCLSFLNIRLSIHEWVAILILKHLSSLGEYGLWSLGFLGKFIWSKCLKVLIQSIFKVFEILNIFEGLSLLFWRDFWIKFVWFTLLFILHEYFNMIILHMANHWALVEEPFCTAF